MTSNLESWRRAAYNAEECLAGCLASPEIAKHLDQSTARTILEKIHQARIEMLAASEEIAQAAAGEPVAWPAWAGTMRHIGKPKELILRFARKPTAEEFHSVTEAMRRGIVPPAAAHGDGAPKPSLWAELDNFGFVIDHTQDRGLAQEWLDSGRQVTAYAAMRAQAGEGGEV